MGDFDACRFDFRLDNKGLTPSKRKRPDKRTVPYNTVYKCKTCGIEFESRPALLAHKAEHNTHSCGFCGLQFNKKAALREHVNTVHYIDKLKLGYRSEYSRRPQSNSSDDLQAGNMLTMPPLIPVSDIDAGVVTPPPTPSVSSISNRLVTTNTTEVISTSAPRNNTGAKTTTDLPPLMPLATSQAVMNPALPQTNYQSLTSTQSSEELKSDNDVGYERRKESLEQAYRAGVLASQAFALAKASSQCSGEKVSTEPSNVHKDGLPNKQPDSTSLAASSSQNMIPSIYSPQMVQAGKATTIPIQSPVFPFPNPFLTPSSQKQQNSVSVATTNVSSPSTSVPNAMSPGYVMMTLPLLVPPQSLAGSGSSSQVSQLALPNYSLAMAQALTSLAMSGNGGDVSNIASLLAASQLQQQLTQGQVPPLAKNGTKNTNESMKDVTVELEPGEIKKASNVRPQLPNLHSVQSDTNKGNRPVLQVKPGSISFVQPENIDDQVLTSQATANHVNCTIETSRDKELSKELATVALPLQMASAIKPYSCSEVSEPQYSGEHDAEPNAASQQTNSAPVVSYIEPIMAPTGATSNKSRNTKSARLGKSSSVSRVAGDSVRGTKRRKQSCPSRAASNLEDDADFVDGMGIGCDANSNDDVFEDDNTSVQNYEHVAPGESLLKYSNRTKITKGLTRMVDRLWQNKSSRPSSVSDQPSRESSISPPLNPLQIDEHEAQSKENVSRIDSRQNENVTKTSKVGSMPTRNGTEGNIEFKKGEHLQEISGENQDTDAMIASAASKVYMELVGYNRGIQQIQSSSTQHILANIPQDHTNTNQGVFSRFKLNKKPESQQHEFCMKFHSCKVCKQLFDTAEEMWEHALIHNSNPRYRCPKAECKFTCDTIEQLVDHQVTLHINDINNTTGKSSSQTGSKSINQSLVKRHTPTLVKSVSQPTGVIKDTSPRKHDSQLYFICSFENCKSTFLQSEELAKHVDSVHRKALCPESASRKNEAVMTDQINSQISSAQPLIEDGPYGCSHPHCGKTFKEMRHLRAHMTIHTGEKPLVCPLCRYAARHRSSMNWHMKSRHNLEKTKTAQNRTIYVDVEGNMVCSFRMDQNSDDTCSESSGESPRKSPTKSVDFGPSDSAEHEMDRSVVVHSGQVQIERNEPEEIAVSNNTIASGTPLFNYNDEPLDMSMKKPEINKAEAKSGVSKTPVGIVQPFLHIPAAATPGVYEYNDAMQPFLSDLSNVPTNTVNNESSEPPIMQMPNPFLQTQSIGEPSNLDSKLGDMGAEGQFYTFRLNNKVRKVSRSGATVAKKNDKVISYPCIECEQVFDDAELMWRHRLQLHADNVRIWCDTCDYTSTRPEEVLSHVMSTHGKEVGENKAFQCFICARGYSSKFSLNHHLIRHSEGGPPKFKCPYRGCESVVNTRGALGNHVKRVHLRVRGARPLSSPDTVKPECPDTEHIFRCDIFKCQRTFNDSRLLKHHKKTEHAEENPLKCHLCDYTCKQRNSLNWHMKARHNLEKWVSFDRKTVYY